MSTSDSAPNETTAHCHAEATQRVDDARQRLERDSQTQVEQQRRAIVRDMLTVYDDLERTLSASNDSTSEPDDRSSALLQGIEMVRDSFLDKLAQHGAAPFDNDGQRFDPHRHEAIGTEPVAAAQVGTIVRTLQRGFTMSDQVLRPARVLVGKG